MLQVHMALSSNSADKACWWYKIINPLETVLFRSVHWIGVRWSSNSDKPVSITMISKILTPRKLFCFWRVLCIGMKCERWFVVTPCNLSWESDGGTEKGPLMLHVLISLSLLSTGWVWGREWRVYILTLWWCSCCSWTPPEGKYINPPLTTTRSSSRQSPRSDGVPLSGESPTRRDFPRQSHRVDARRDFSRRPHQTCWVPGTKIDLGLVIDIAQLLLSNVRMREMCWHGDLTQSRLRTAKTTQPWLSPAGGGIRW